MREVIELAIAALQLGGMSIALEFGGLARGDVLERSGHTHHVAIPVPCRLTGLAGPDNAAVLALHAAFEIIGLPFRKAPFIPLLELRTIFRVQTGKKSIVGRHEVRIGDAKHLL